VYVHDGLHHLAQPLDGVSEMARVAGSAVSINEPARAAITQLAVRAGKALEYEESGNRVGRLRPRDVVAVLRSRGFEPLVAERYAMYYQHTAGPAAQLLSRSLLLPAGRAGYRAVDRMIGRFGNKLTVQAYRVW
jgi:hypothetical protein